VQKIDEIE
jgi:hypothetical protein